MPAWTALALLLALGPSTLGCGPTSRAPEGELRILSLSPSISSILVALGAGSAVVGVDRFSLRIEGLEDVPSLGGLFAPDLERALELRPTLVLGVANAAQRSFFEQLRRRGVGAHQVDPHTLDEVLASYLEIGALVDRTVEAEALESIASAANRRPKKAGPCRQLRFVPPAVFKTEGVKS